MWATADNSWAFCVNWGTREAGAPASRRTEPLLLRAERRITRGVSHPLSPPLRSVNRVIVSQSPAGQTQTPGTLTIAHMFKNTSVLIVSVLIHSHFAGTCLCVRARVRGGADQL